MCVTSNPLGFRPQVQEVCEMSLEMVGTSENRWLDYEYTQVFEHRSFPRSQVWSGHEEATLGHTGN